MVMICQECGATEQGVVYLENGPDDIDKDEPVCAVCHMPDVVNYDEDYGQDR